MAWTNPRTWIPGEFVTASMLNTHLRDNLNYLYGNALIASYTATLADVANTTTETAIITFTVPANAWADGELIRILFTYLAKNNKGTTGFPVLKGYVGAGAGVVFGSSNFDNDANEYALMGEINLQRVGADVYIKGPTLMMFTEGATWSNQPTLAVQAAHILTANAKSTPANFTANNTVAIKATLDAANATYYIKAKAAHVLHFKK